LTSANVQGFYGPSGKDRDDATRSGLQNRVAKTCIAAASVVTVAFLDFRSTTETDIRLHRGICRKGQQGDIPTKPGVICE
jgi:hypothetical protein